MKKRFILGTLLGIILGAVGAIVVYFLTQGKVAWEIYLEETIIPSVAAGGTSLAVIMIGAYPCLKKVVNAASLFNKASSDMSETVEQGKTANKSIEGFKSEVKEAIKEGFKQEQTILQEEDKQLKEILKKSTETEQIVKIGFCNQEELVHKGYASEIAKVGEENERNET